MAVNLASKYSSQLDQVFTAGSYTDRYINRKYNFDGVKTVNVYTVTTVAPSDYSRANTGDRFGGNNELQDIVTSYQLANDKSFKIVIDRGNYEQGALAKKAGEVMRAEMEEQVIPMIDANRLSKAAIGAAAASQYYAPTANDGYGDVLKMSAALDEAKAPIAGRVLWVTPTFYNAIKKQIHRDALLGAKQIMNTRIITDSELVDGTILLGRFIFDSFVLNGKKKAVAAIGTGSLS